MKNLFRNSSLVRSSLGQFLGFSHSGQRDLYAQFGYPVNVSVEELYAVYQRNDIANRIIRAFPQATWRQLPIIRDEAGSSPEKGTNDYSPFVEAVEKFFRENNLFASLERLDRISSIGRYGILVMGFADGKPFDQPFQGKAPLKYVTPFGEASLHITKFETDRSSSRYGLPVLYRVSQRVNETMLGEHSPLSSFNIHYTRVLHVSEFLDENDVFGLPRLLPIYNRLKDLEKVVGGSAEVFWLTASRGLAFWADKEAKLDDDMIQSMKEQAEEFQHQLRRYIVGQGVTAQVLSPEAPDPEPNASVLLDLIAGASGVPKRILLGTERGELASSQDENNFNARIEERRANFVAPFILRPFVQRLIDSQNLPQPQGEWWAEWAKDENVPALTASQIAGGFATALSTYVNSPGAELVVPPAEFRERFLKLPPETEYALPDAKVEELPEEQDVMPGQPAEGQLTDTQVANLREIIESVAQRLMPIETAVQVIVAAFPSIDEDSAWKMLLPLDDFVPAVNKVANSSELEEQTEDDQIKPYVFRNVINPKAIASWAEKYGFKLNDDLHVTLCYSSKGVVSSKALTETLDDNNLMVEADKSRKLEVLGDKRAIVLSFSHDGLEHRHRELRKLGASHEYKLYRPHVTLFYDPENTVDINGIKPYDGAIVLGPEQLSEISEESN